MATIPEIEARIHALWTKGEAHTCEESVELGQLLTTLEAEMPPGDFYTHVLEVLHIPARDAQHFMAQYRESQGGVSANRLYGFERFILQSVRSPHVKATFERKGQLDPLLRRSWSWRTV
jgi:hypothetical protein